MAKRRWALHKAADDPLNGVADALAPGLKKTLVRQMNDLLTDAQLDKLVRAVRDADVAAITTLIPAYDPRSPGVWQALEDSYRGTIKDVVQQAGKKALALYGIRSAFALDNPYTAKWLQEQAGTLLGDLSTTAQDNIRAMVTEAWVEGIPPNQLADMIRTNIGLNEQQAAAVRRRYESTRAALEDGGMSPSRAASAASGKVQDYADDLLDQRAETIARTETIAASTAGAHDAWGDAKDKGLLPDDTQREWVASPEGKGACEYCMALDGERVAFDDDFETDAPYTDGTINRPPLHQRCRCVCRIVIPGLNDAQSLDDIREENEGM